MSKEISNIRYFDLVPVDLHSWSEVDHDDGHVRDDLRDFANAYCRHGVWLYGVLTDNEVFVEIDDQERLWFGSYDDATADKYGMETRDVEYTDGSAERQKRSDIDGQLGDWRTIEVWGTDAAAD